MKSFYARWIFRTLLLLRVHLVVACPGCPGYCEQFSLPTWSPSAVPPFLRELKKLDSHIAIDLEDSNSARKAFAQILPKIQHTSQTTSFLPTPQRVTSINVSGFGSVDDWILIEQVFAALPKLEIIYWDGSQAMTSALLKIIEDVAPQAKLFYTIKTHSPEMSMPHRALINSKILYSLDAELNYGYLYDNVTLPLILTALSTCPNLRELSISINNNNCGYGGSPYAFDFDSHPNIKLAPLEVLKLEGYVLDNPEDGSSDWPPEREAFNLLKHRWSHTAPDLARNLEMWKKLMDFSKLHTLVVDNANEQTLASFSGKTLPSLKHLTLGALAMDEKVARYATLNFVRSLDKQLESFAIAVHGFGIADAVGAVVEQNCGRLRSFKFDKLIQLPSVNVDQLLSACGHLRELDIAIPRPNVTKVFTGHESISELVSWDPYLFTILKKAAGLKHLTIRIPAPAEDIKYPTLKNGILDWEQNDPREQSERFRLVNGLPDLVDDVVNRNTSLRLFQKLRHLEIVGPLGEGDKGGLERLDIFLGDWEGRAANWGDIIGRGARIRVALYECTLDQRGHEKCEGSQTRSIDYEGDSMEYIW